MNHDHDHSQSDSLHDLNDGDPAARRFAPAPDPRLGLSKAHTATFAKTTITIQGGLLTHHRPKPRSIHQPPPRSECRGFSKGARARMRRFIATLDRDVLPIFVTLTYGSDWDQANGRNPVTGKARTKEHFDKFWKMVQRKYPEFGCIWKLEPQDRGAPHYHLLIYRNDGEAPFICMDWLARAWAKASEDESENHIKAGTRVEHIRSYFGILSYAAKYMSKLTDTDWDWGTAWGTRSKTNLPIMEAIDREITEGQEAEVFDYMARVQAYQMAYKKARQNLAAERRDYENEQYWWHVEACGKKLPKNKPKPWPDFDKSPDFIMEHECLAEIYLEQLRERPDQVRTSIIMDPGYFDCLMRQGEWLDMTGEFVRLEDRSSFRECLPPEPRKSYAENYPDDPF